MSWLSHQCDKDGHRFEGRYDVKPGASLDNLDFSGSSVLLEKLLKGFQIRTYVRDVCTRCGKTMERDD